MLTILLLCGILTIVVIMGMKVTKRHNALMQILKELLEENNERTG